MTDTGRAAATGARSTSAGPRRDEGTGTDDRSGWISFAAVMLMLLGTFQIVEGLVGLFRPDYYLVGSSGLVVAVSYTGWGWFHLILGVVVLAAGFGVMSGSTWARLVGIALASLSALANLAFIAAYPVWSIIVIALDVAVIYALTTDRRPART